MLIGHCQHTNASLKMHAQHVLNEYWTTNNDGVKNYSKLIKEARRVTTSGYQTHVFGVLHSRRYQIYQSCRKKKRIKKNTNHTIDRDITKMHRINRENVIAVDFEAVDEGTKICVYHVSCITDNR